MFILFIIFIPTCGILHACVHARLDEREGPNFKKDTSLERSAKAVAAKSVKNGAGGAPAVGAGKGGVAKGSGAGAAASAKPTKPHYPFDEMGTSIGYSVMNAPGAIITFEFKVKIKFKSMDGI